jgi:hypothetical protein
MSRMRARIWARSKMAYSRMETLLRLPFAQSSRLDGFRSIIDVPLIARKSAIAPVPHAKRRALLGSRAQVSADALAFASASAPEFEFVVPSPHDNFTDVLASCDVVIAKLGFSMVAECIAARKPLLYPPRQGFREESLLEGNVARHIPALRPFRSRTSMEAIGRRTSRSCPRGQR